MNKTSIIALAFVAMVFGTIMLAEPTSASPFFIIGKHHGFARGKQSNVAAPANSLPATVKKNEAFRSQDSNPDYYPDYPDYPED